MKTKLLYALLFICSYSISQTLPTGHYGKFEFTNGSLENGSTSGGPDLTGNVISLGTDRNGNPDNTINSSQALTGHTLGASNYNNTTLSFWMKNTTIQSNFSQRVIQMYGSGGNGYRLEIGANLFAINAKNTSAGSPSQFVQNLSVNLSDGIWHHVVVRTTDVSIDSSVIIEVFIDNVLQQSIAGSVGPYISGVSNTFIQSAQMIVNPTNTYLGAIDDVYLYKSALTDAEISSLYNYTPVLGTNIRYVNANVSGGDNTGTSWANAHRDLQSALASANSSDEIWIAQGIYSPAITSRSTYFDISRANLKIYGGFVGTETSIDDRVIGAYPTTLSGDLQNNDANVSDFIANYSNTTRNADNSYYVVNITSQGENLLLDGLTISDAHNNIPGTANHGGAIMKHASVANLTLRNCIIKDNVSRNFCAGLYAEFDLGNRNGNRGSLVIDRCQFTNNMSRVGSGVYFRVGFSTNVDLTVTNSVFDHNLAGDLNTTNAKGFAGSAMWLRTAGSDSDANYAIYNNTFVNNRDIGEPTSDDRFRAPVIMANHGNFNNNIANAIVANCIFWNNTGLGDHASTGGLTRAISDMNGTPITSVNVYNSLDPLDFVEGSITSAVNTITTDPLFTDIANGDYSLTANSSAVDSGDSSYPFGTLDILGNQRIVNTVDMGAYELNTSSLSTQQSLTLKNFKLYPNPVRTKLNIQLEETLQKVEVFSILGSKVLESSNASFNVTKLPSGIYILKILTENGKVGVKRFIKE